MSRPGCKTFQSRNDLEESNKQSSAVVGDTNGGDRNFEYRILNIEF